MHARYPKSCEYTHHTFLVIEGWHPDSCVCLGIGFQQFSPPEKKDVAITTCVFHHLRRIHVLLYVLLLHVAVHNTWRLTPAKKTVWVIPHTSLLSTRQAWQPHSHLRVIHVPKLTGCIMYTIALLMNSVTSSPNPQYIYDGQTGAVMHIDRLCPPSGSLQAPHPSQAPPRPGVRTPPTTVRPV